MAKAIQNETTIKILINKIRDEIETGRNEIRKSFENQRTKTYWNIGKHIHEYMIDYSDKDTYGDSLFKRIAEELDIGWRTLYRAVQFYETYPNILSPVTKLKWSHFLILLTVKDKDKRNEYRERILNENLNKRELEDLIKNEKIKEQYGRQPIIMENRGMPYIYTIKAINTNNRTDLLIDLGFRIYVNKLKKEDAYNEENILQVKKNNNRYSFKAANNISHNQIYTYKAYIKEIIDGDTIWLNIDLGFDTWTCQKVRLRKINTGGLKTKNGKQAKDYIIKQLNNCEYVVIKTYWRDKYNRYLADIFYDEAEKDVNKLAEKGRYLNQKLLDKGLAEKYYM